MSNKTRLLINKNMDILSNKIGDTIYCDGV